MRRLLLAGAVAVASCATPSSAPPAASASVTGAPTAPSSPARPLGVADLAISPDATLVPPPALEPELTARDLSILRYAIERGYGGVGHIDDALLQALFAELEALRAERDPDVLCAGIGDALARLPDAHLSARIRGAKCGEGYRAHRREPTVGTNVHPEGSAAPWALDMRDVTTPAGEPRRVAVMSIVSFPAGDASAWDGFDDAIAKAASADALVVDLRGNGGGDDTRGYQLASALLGADVQPAYARVVRRQTPEAITLLLNWIDFMLLAAAKEPEAPPPEIPSFLLELKRTQLAVLAGEAPERVETRVTPTAVPATPAFDRPIAVLVDAQCGSSCESTAEALRTHPRAQLVGQRTAGFVHFGDGGTLVLPASQIRVYLPTKVNLYEDGAFYDKVGFEPDVAVAPGSDALAVALKGLFASD